MSGQGVQICDILNMQQIARFRKRSFICFYTLDECATEYRVKLLNSLGQLLEQSPGTRIFVVGRPHILLEIGTRFAERAESIYTSSKRQDIATYFCSRLAADATPDVIDRTLKVGILEKIPTDIVEM